MAWTIDSALNNDELEKVEKTEDGFSIWVKGISVEIKIIISVNGARGGFNYHLSHLIKTPEQIGPYRSSIPWGDDIAYTLHKAVTAITDYYKEAVRAGHKPSSTWLVKNK